MSIALAHSLASILWCITSFSKEEWKYTHGFFGGIVFAITLIRAGWII